MNAVGSFLMAILAGTVAAKNPEMRGFLLVGVLGSFTTFSAFSRDAVEFFQRGDALLASGYVAGSAALSILAFVAGLALARTFTA